jgi:hypothetical protein
VSALRSDGWAVRPSFAPHGPTAPVSLLFDDFGVTQLAGDPPVAWQIPWAEITHVRLERRRAGATIVAVIAEVTYQWRRSAPASRADLDDVVAVLRAHGAREMPSSRRRRALVVAALVTFASFAGYFGSLGVSSSAPSVLRALEALNLSARDVSGTWASTSGSSLSVLNTFLPAPGKVIYNAPTTSTTIGLRDAAFTLAASHFQSCLGVPNVRDRVYGLAGQSPTYQVSSPVFSSSDFGGIQVESSAQFYDSTRSVASDVAEMSRGSFGRCFVNSTADLMIGQSSSATPNLTTGRNLAPRAFVKGWVRGGSVAVSLPTLGIARATLVVFVMAAGHYEVTLGALVVNPAPALSTLDDVANELLVRVTSTSALST